MGKPITLAFALTLLALPIACGDDDDDNDTTDDTDAGAAGVRAGSGGVRAGAGGGGRTGGGGNTGVSGGGRAGAPVAGNLSGGEGGTPGGAGMGGEPGGAGGEPGGAGMGGEPGGAGGMPGGGGAGGMPGGGGAGGEPSAYTAEQLALCEALCNAAEDACGAPITNCVSNQCAGYDIFNMCQDEYSAYLTCGAAGDMFDCPAPAGGGTGASTEATCGALLGAAAACQG